jgi:hypothetical protein
MVGQLAATRIGWERNKLAIGSTIWFDNRPWMIVGQFAAPHTVMDAEIWCPLTDLQYYDDDPLSIDLVYHPVFSD